MSEAQLRDWIVACAKMELHVKPAKARRSWKLGRQKAIAELEKRLANSSE